ncbi:MAG: hypothetical protein ABII23_02375, partial [bacterium]
GAFFLILGWLYLYKRKIMLYINSFIRNNIFNDMYILTQNRKIGVFLLLLAFIFLYLGYVGLTVPR